MSLICDMPNLKSNPNQLGNYPKIIDNQLYSFTNQQIWLPEIPQEINSIEINFEFTTGDAVSGDYWVLLGQKGSNRTCPQIEIDDSQIQFYTSYDTSSWLTRMVAPVEVNTTYVLNAKWNNVDKKIIATLTDKSGTTVPLTIYSGYTDTTDGIVWQDYGTLCSDGGGHFFNGLFNLEKSYIKINGSMWWKGLTKVNCDGLLAPIYEALGGAPDQEDEGGGGGGTYNINLVGNVENKNGVLSGFSTENYGYFNNPMGATSSNFEIVVKIKLTSAFPSKTVRFFGGNIDNTNKLCLYMYNGKIYVGVNTWSMSGTTVLDLNTDYYIKVKLDLATGWITLYLSTTGEFSGEETIEDTRSITSAQAIPPIFYVGYIPTNTLAFDFGEIDLNGCYIKDGESLVWQGVTK